MIYIHVPFCGSFCTYCDFYSETAACPGTAAGLFSRYTECLLKEIEARKTEIESTLETDTLYIGGGTPSFLPDECLKTIVEALGRRTYREFTIEVNPEDIVRKGPSYPEFLKGLGVNRVSMGVQSLDDAVLRWMNRRHSASGAREAYEMLRGSGIGNVSVDLIFGIGRISDNHNISALHSFPETLERSLKEIISWKPEHISAYQLSIEEGSALARMVEDGRYAEASEDRCREQYDHICTELRSAGYHHYEISNWALPGHEAVHNAAYWARKPYVGLGPGAHSFLILPDGTQQRSWNTQVLSGWTAEKEILTPEEVREETLMLGLRTDKGVDGKIIPEKDWFISDSIISDLV